MSPLEESTIVATLGRMESNLREDIKSAECRVREDITGIRVIQDEHSERIVALEVKGKTTINWTKVLTLGIGGGGLAFVPRFVHHLDAMFSSTK